MRQRYLLNRHDLEFGKVNPLAGFVILEVKNQVFLRPERELAVYGNRIVYAYVKLFVR